MSQWTVNVLLINSMINWTTAFPSVIISRPKSVSAPYPYLLADRRLLDY